MHSSPQAIPSWLVDFNIKVVDLFEECLVSEECDRRQQEYYMLWVFKLLPEIAVLGIQLVNINDQCEELKYQINSKENVLVKHSSV